MSLVTNPRLNPSGSPQEDAIKQKLVELETEIMRLPAGRRKSVALTQLELAGMMAVKAAVLGDS